LGHVAGLDHSDPAAGENQLMDATLSIGVRKVLETKVLDTALDLRPDRRP
jgi:hypothetical protein